MTATIHHLPVKDRTSQARVPEPAQEDVDWFRRAGIPEEHVAWVADVWALHYGPDTAS